MEASSSLMEVGGLGDADGPDAGEDPKAAADSLFPMITVSISYHICKNLNLEMKKMPMLIFKMSF